MIRAGTIVGIYLISLFSSVGFAQEATPCEQTLNQATDEFNAGRFYGVPSMLAACIDRGFTREQRQRAYLLLTQTYLLLDDPLAAENSYLEVLRANPEYTTDINQDPIDVVYLSKKFTASPVFSLFGRIGGNVSPVRVIHTIDPYSGSAQINNNYSLQPGWQIGGGADWNYSENLALTGEVIYATMGYKKEQSNVFQNDTREFNDRLRWLTIPISVKYSLNRFYKGKVRKILPYAFGGFSFSYLIADKGEIQIFNHDLTDNGRTTQIAESPTLDFSPYRNKVNNSIFVGGGAKYKWGLDYLFAELRYNFGLNNVVVPTSTFGGAPMQEYGHVDDYFRLDNLSFSVGLVKPLYKPRKLKRARTKSVLKSLKKEDESQQEK